MEILDQSPPHCPEDDVVMREVAGGWRCPECGHLRQARDLEARWASRGGDTPGA